VAPVKATHVLLFAALALTQSAQPQQIAMTRVYPQPRQIGLFIAASDGSHERALLSQGDLDYDATWAPDGRSIVFTSERNGSADLYRVKSDGFRSRATDGGPRVRRSGVVLS
jgi:Tol biopolymer transport system component